MPFLRPSLLVVALMLLVWTASPAVADNKVQQTDQQTLDKAQERARQTLKGLNGVGVIVEDLQPQIEQAGLPRKQLQTDLELRLRLAGIRVLTDDAWLNAKGVPYLYVNLNAVIADGNSVLYSLHVSLDQTVLLERDTSIVAYGASTWSTGALGRVGWSQVSVIRDEVKELVDEFINAYLSVNPGSGRR